METATKNALARAVASGKHISKCFKNLSINSKQGRQWMA
jgi:hypothetical protein